jgi:hypothetical protein
VSWLTDTDKQATGVASHTATHISLRIAPQGFSVPSSASALGCVEVGGDDDEMKC